MALSSVFRLTRWAAATAIGFVAVAMLLYPGGTFRNRSAPRYSFFHNSLSDLGSRVAWGGQPNSSSALLFGSGVALFALAGVGGVLALARVYSSSGSSRRLTRAAVVMAVLSCAGLAGAAVTPQDGNLVLHQNFTLLASAAFVIADLLFAAVTALDGRFRKRVTIGWLIIAATVVTWIALTRSRPTTDVEIMAAISLQKVVAATLVVNLFLQSREAERVVRRVAPDPRRA